MPALNATIDAVTEIIRRRSENTRAHYLARIDTAIENGPVRKTLSCTNQAHAFAAFPDNDKQILVEMRQPSIAIVSAYNDMLSAHQPFQLYPDI